MDTTNLLTKFARIGARLKVVDRPTRRFRAPVGVISLDVQADRNGEYLRGRFARRRPIPRSPSWTCSPPTGTCS